MKNITTIVWTSFLFSTLNFSNQQCYFCMDILSRLNAGYMRLNLNYDKINIIYLL